uniref:MULE transposase domain-containing protein n=1 Tax=Ditylenchus dipsaci TaxID=166011 RepID=A0A915E9H5_9BILA
MDFCTGSIIRKETVPIGDVSITKSEKAEKQVANARVVGLITCFDQLTFLKFFVRTRSYSGWASKYNVRAQPSCRRKSICIEEVPIRCSRASCGYKKEAESHHNISISERQTRSKTSTSTLSCGRTIRKRRHVANLEPANPKTLRELMGNYMLIFSSPRQLRLLHSCNHIISDGTFKYAPKGVMQIYRIFGLVRQLHATPVVTVLMKRKNADLYKRMWEKVPVRESLLEINVVNSISFANFDAEIAAYSTFAEVFPGVSVKLCSFHVKQGLYRKEVMLEDNDDEEDAHEAAVQLAELRGLAHEIPEEEAHLNVVFDAE